MMSHLVKEIIDGVPDRVSQIKLFAIGNHHPILDHLIQLFVDVLDEVLGGCFQKEDLVVVVAMM